MRRRSYRVLDRTPDGIELRGPTRLAAFGLRVADLVLWLTGGSPSLRRLHAPLWRLDRAGMTYVSDAPEKVRRMVAGHAGIRLSLQVVPDRSSTR